VANAAAVTVLLFLALAFRAAAAPSNSNSNSNSASKTVSPAKIVAPAKAVAASPTNPPANAAANAAAKDKERDKAEKALLPVSWSADLPRAQAKAKVEGKSVLIHFTGSDWCGWCMKLRKDVFAKLEFEQYARSNLVLVAIDFPKRKLLPPMAQAINQRVAEQYQVQGFPTLILVGSNGDRLGTVNYGHGGARTFLAEVEKLRNPPPEVPFEKARTPQTNTPRRAGRSKGERARKPEVVSYKRTSSTRP
jgi:protein disulfide-isomerase